MTEYTLHLDHADQLLADDLIFGCIDVPADDTEDDDNDFTVH